MKLNRNALALCVGLLLSIAITSCEKSASDQEYGIENIYIPQSLISGSDLNYLVPSGLDSASRNYKIDRPSGKLNIILGVSRSGEAEGRAYAVDLKSRPDTVAMLIANNTVSNGIPLPENMYMLPSKIEVSSGENGKTFYLSVDYAALKANLAGKKAVTAIELVNPSAYALNRRNNKVVVIIDVDALKLP